MRQTTLSHQLCPRGSFDEHTKRTIKISPKLIPLSHKMASSQSVPSADAGLLPKSKALGVSCSVAAVATHQFVRATVRRRID